eukprot:CAMPEP_0195303352 /NCGR_PEP_ID=MMETSP0707-20130614/32609_1 /TAXON_ID=33640 /ORGANISM="Asterionellopsis glacialis, Strain CCMP134" /LENGTH=286 /DNA_ID=CAMNT_0040366861 /DNA_START=80 /DNA_END=940 /DNA_ORIENTATION=-
MEEALLHQMIGEREARINEMKEKLRILQEEKIDAMELKLEVQKDKTSQLGQKFEKRVGEYKRDQAKLKRQISTKSRELTHQSASLHLYMDIMRDIMPELVHSTYVIRMQSQLCGAMHAMYILDQQMEMLKKHCNMIIKPLRDVIANNEDEKCNIDLSLMNELVAMDDEKRIMEESYKEKLRKVEDQLFNFLQIRYSSKDTKGDSDDSTEEENPEDDDTEDDESVVEEDGEIERSSIEHGENNDLKDHSQEILQLEEDNVKQIQEIKSLRAKIKLLYHFPKTTSSRN